MKKVLIIAIDMRCGGVEKSILEFLDILDSLNYQVSILFLKENGFLFNQLPDVKYTILKPQYKSKFNPLFLLNRIKCKILLKFPTLIFKFILHEKFDSVISFMEHEPLQILSAKINSKKIARICFNFSSSLSKNKKQIKILENDVDVIWAISQEQAEQINYYNQNLGSKVVMLGNFRNINKIRELSQQSDIKYSKPTIVTLSRLSDHKRLDIALKAFAVIRKLKYDWDIHIIGAGPELESLQNLRDSLGITENVRMDGEFMLNPFPHIRAASLFLFSSEAEGFGGVLVEALALGCPILSTNCPVGPAEILDNGNYGYLVAVNDVMAMANGIIEMMTNQELRSRFITKSSIRAEYYDIEHAADKFKDLL